MWTVMYSRLMKSDQPVRDKSYLQDAISHSRTSIYMNIYNESNSYEDSGHKLAIQPEASSPTKNQSKRQSWSTPKSVADTLGSKAVNNNSLRGDRGTNAYRTSARYDKSCIKTSPQPVKKRLLSKSFDLTKRINSYDDESTAKLTSSSNMRPNRSHNSSLNQSRILERTIDKRFPIMDIKERLNSEGNSTKRSANIFLETDRLTEVDLQHMPDPSTRAFKPEDEEEETFRTSGRAAMSLQSVDSAEEFDLDSAVRINKTEQKSTLEHNSILEGTKKYKSIKYTIKHFSGNKPKDIQAPASFLAPVLHSKRRSSTSTKLAASQNESAPLLVQKKEAKQPGPIASLPSKHPFTAKIPRANRTVARRNSGLPQQDLSTQIKMLERRMYHSKDPITNMRSSMGSIKAPSNKSFQPSSYNKIGRSSFDHTRPIDLSVNDTTIVEENYDDSYGRALAASLNFIREKRVDFSTLSVILPTLIRCIIKQGYKRACQTT